MNWIYNGNPFTEEDANSYYGFVYEIVNLTNNKRYIGRKYLSKAKTITVKGKKKKTRVSSDWINYWSSSDEVKADVKLLGEHNFTRTILYLCNSRSECNYLETKEIFLKDALLSENYYNKWVSCKIHKAHVLNKGIYGS